MAAAAESGAMERLMAALGGASGAQSRGLPPVERWNPPFCGDIDMRISTSGQWFYMGSPIGRLPLVKLFSSVIRRDGDDYFLVTPAEKVGIVVEDAPFQAVEMAVEGEGETRSLGFRTNIDERVMVGDGHPLRFERGAGEGLKPYVLVRRNLWARVTRALTYDLLALGEIRDTAQGPMFGVFAGGVFHAAVPAGEIEGMA